MTAIKFKQKPRWRETAVVDSMTRRLIVVACEPQSILLRLKGTRQVLRVPFGVAFLRGAMLEAARIRMEKINARKARRRAK